MRYLLAAQTDIGTTKNTNQDCFDIRLASSGTHGDILLALVCDGMGGLQKGEVASATVTEEFTLWFENALPNYLNSIELNFKFIEKEWGSMIDRLNKRIREYGAAQGFNLGTTLVAALCIGDKMFIANVGDSRIYKISSSELTRLTTDQSLVAQKIALGELKPEEEETFAQRNVLLQCIGASITLKPEIKEYPLEKDCIYLMCSDGFRHEISESEMQGLLSPTIINNENDFNSTLIDIIDLLKSRNERDNITAVAFKPFE